MTRQEAWEIYFAKCLKGIEADFKECVKAGVPLEEIAAEGPKAVWLIPLYEEGKKPETLTPNNDAERGVKLMKGEISRKGVYLPRPLPKDWFEQMVERGLEKAKIPA